MNAITKQTVLMAARTVLLIVDVQKALIQDGPHHKDAFLADLQQLLIAARESGIETVYIQHDGGKGDELEAGTEGFAVASEVSPRSGEKVIVKTRNSAFLDTPLQEYLDGKNIDTLILCGMQTEYCIDATCKSALERGYTVIVPKGCTTTFDNPLISAETVCRFYEEGIWDGRFAAVLPAETVCGMLKNVD